MRLQFILLIVILASCKKETAEENLVYKEYILYSEKFNEELSWQALPLDYYYKPGKNCFRIVDKMLKLRFDRSLDGCGCAWIGAEKELYNLNMPDQKIGIRLTIDQGFFQNLMRSHVVTSNQMNLTPVIQSTFRFQTSQISMTLPNDFSGWISEDSIMDFESNKLSGTEFEMIWNKGQAIFYMDGVKLNTNLVNIQKSGSDVTGIKLSFHLGHEATLPTLNQILNIKKIEVFTWDGEFEK